MSSNMAPSESGVVGQETGTRFEPSTASLLLELFVPFFIALVGGGLSPVRLELRLRFGCCCVLLVVVANLFDVLGGCSEVTVPEVPDAVEALLRLSPSLRRCKLRRNEDTV